MDKIFNEYKTVKIGSLVIGLRPLNGKKRPLFDFDISITRSVYFDLPEACK